MDNEIIEILEYLSWKTLIIALLSFILTMIIKYPIKKFSSKLPEEKRKAVNIVIFLIPALLSFLQSLLYFGFFESNWTTFAIVDNAMSSWLISLTIYAIYERIVIIIKAIRSGKTQLNADLTKDTINFIKSNIKDLTSNLKQKEKSLDSISSKLKSLNQIKEVLENNTASLDISKISETNIEIQNILNEETSLKTQIKNIKEQINNYTNQLYSKGEQNGI